jgi:RNA polymerase sigma-70 factor (ECF subfamily)
MNAHHENGSSSTQTSLIRRAQLADPTAWERLTQLYGPVVYGWARRAGLQPQDASDVMQDVFHSLTSKLPTFERRDSNDSFRGWLWTITRNKVRDHFRRLKRQADVVGGSTAYQNLQQLAEAPPDAESDGGAAELNGIRRRALELVSGEFESRTWQAFWRTTIEGDAPADVAADLGISVWAVYKARSRVLQKLREEFAELMGD